MKKNTSHITEKVSALKKRIEDSRNLSGEVKRLREHISSFEVKEAFIEDLLHDLRRVNRELKRLLGALIEDDSSDDIKMIWAFATFMSIRMSTYDYEVNTNMLEKSATYPVRIYSRIERFARVVKEMYRSDEITYRFKGSSQDRIKTTDLIDIVIFVVIDNAFKYAPSKSEVLIEYIKVVKDKILRVKISNEAILPDADEMNLITDRHYRGRNTRDFVKGSGLGLDIFKRICNIIGIDYNFNVIPSESDPNRGIFSVYLYFKNVF